MNERNKCDMPLISVIVPVYKVEQYLDKCVNSIINQTYPNIEVILVDDGSPDRCPEMCDEWRKKDNRIRVIHQSNSGAGNARNSALDVAQGEFVIFVDSDDYISPIMIEFLYHQFEEGVDVVECGYILATDNDVLFDGMKKAYDTELFTAQAAVEENIKDCIFRQLIWNKMYRRSVIGAIRFPEGKKIDDEFWTYRVLGNSQKLVFTNKILYAYRQQEGSVMHLLDAKRRLEAIEAKIQRHEYICKEMPELEEVSLGNIWGTCIYQGQLAIRTLNGVERTKILAFLNNVLKQYSIKHKKLQLPMKQKIWLKLARFSFVGVCRLKNILKVGR